MRVETVGKDDYNWLIFLVNLQPRGDFKLFSNYNWLIFLVNLQLDAQASGRRTEL